jgi:hypothetical protein
VRFDIVPSTPCILSENAGFQRIAHVHQVRFQVGKTAEDETCVMLKFTFREETISRNQSYN